MSAPAWSSPAPALIGQRALAAALGRRLVLPLHRGFYRGSKMAAFVRRQIHSGVAMKRLLPVTTLAALFLALTCTQPGFGQARTRTQPSTTQAQPATPESQQAQSSNPEQTTTSPQRREQTQMTSPPTSQAQQRPAQPQPERERERERETPAPQAGGGGQGGGASFHFDMTEVPPVQTR